MLALSYQVSLPSSEATEQFAQNLSPLLGAGDTLLLEGPIGAGKSFFSRALIQSLLVVPEDVPSPTFTLVQTYETPSFAIWHCDLYRLTHPDEAWELGLEEAFTNSLCLIEWPDRLAGETPDDALTLTFDPQKDDTRLLSITTSSTRWGFLKDLINA